MATPPTPIMTDVIVMIMVELLSVFALATKQMKQKPLGECAITIYTLPAVAQCTTVKFAKKFLFKEREIETVLQRLDQLTEDEGRAAVAQTLGFVVAIHQATNEITKMRRSLSPPYLSLPRPTVSCR